MHETLSHFIEQARQKGMDLSSIHLVLRSAGWKEKEIAEALCARELGIPIPERSGVGSPRDAFLHLLAFTALYASVISLVILTFTYIELAFPDPSEFENREWAYSTIRASLSTLIVAYPVFLIVWRFLLREIRFQAEKAASAVRRWLSSLSLFVGSVILMSDVISAVYYFVAGDLTVRFVAKVATLFVIVGGVVAYLALTLRSEAQART